MKLIEPLPLCEKIAYEKSHRSIWNGNQDIDDLRFLVFLLVHGYLMIFGDANLQSIALRMWNQDVLEFLGYLL
jgi:hypothetical protein